jgi:VIT1/CCC1 family predicted Fe2+/Mn2+ transporter
MNMTLQADLRRFLKNRQDEVDSAAQYAAIAALEKDPRLKQIYQTLGKTEERHIAFWEEQIRRAGAAVPGQRRPSWRARTLIWFARRFGPAMVLGTIAQSEAVDRNQYAGQKETAGRNMTHDEHFHAQVLHQLVRTQPRGVSGGVLARIEGRHTAVGGNALRASVLGANDGLCSNLSLIMGVAGATSDAHTLVVTGLAGLLAGACSMALGEWLSVTSSRELAEREIRVESDEVALDPESEAEELRLIYEIKGMAPEEAKRLAEHMLSDPARGLDALTREELGIDPEQLTGSAGEAAAFSFTLFALGAFIPLVPFLFLAGNTAIYASVALSAIALFGLGALITLFTGRSALRSGLRQLALGGLAALITHLLGRLIGASL